MINFVFMLTHSDSTIPGAIAQAMIVAASRRFVPFKRKGKPQTLGPRRPKVVAR